MKALGRHFILDLWGCDPEKINTRDFVEDSLLKAALLANTTVVGTVSHSFLPAGISAIVMIAESHLSIHTWPEHGYAAIDIFTCGENLRPEDAAEYLKKIFGAKDSSSSEIPRGIL